MAQEFGGKNLQGFVANSPLHNVDVLGAFDATLPSGITDDASCVVFALEISIDIEFDPPEPGDLPPEGADCTYCEYDGVDLGDYTETISEAPDGYSCVASHTPGDRTGGMENWHVVVQFHRGSVTILSSCSFTVNWICYAPDRTFPVAEDFTYSREVFMPAQSQRYERDIRIAPGDEPCAAIGIR